MAWWSGEPEKLAIKQTNLEELWRDERTWYISIRSQVLDLESGIVWKGSVPSEKKKIFMDN